MDINLKEIALKLKEHENLEAIIKAEKLTLTEEEIKEVKNIYFNLIIQDQYVFSLS